jgi:thiol-disulfide isomerase/thioredoxin
MLEVTNDMEKVREGKSVVYFTASWCQPCKLIKPQFARAGTIDKDRNYYIVDVEEIHKVWLEVYNIQSVPQMLILDAGVVSHKINSTSTDEILEEVKNVII